MEVHLNACASNVCMFPMSLFADIGFNSVSSLIHLMLGTTRLLTLQPIASLVI